MRAERTIQAKMGCGPLPPKGQASIISLKRQVFDYIRAHGATARSDLTRALDISAGSATALTAELIAQGLLSEAEFPRLDTGRGRPRVALEIIGGQHHVLGIKISGKSMSGSLIDFAGNEVATISKESNNLRRSLDNIVATLGALYSELLKQSGLTRADIHGLAIGLAGIVDTDTGTAIWSPHFAQRDVPLAETASAALGLPVYIDNDANMRTLDALWFGAGRDVPDFAVVTLERGVGMGLVLASNLFRGSRGIGLELGHTKIQLDGALCRCGQRGCLEAYLSDYALSREAMIALDPLPAGSGDLSEGAIVGQLLERAQAGDAIADSIFRRAGRHLAMGLANVVQLFDPKLIILAGRRMQYYDLHPEEIVQEALAMTLAEGRQPPKILIESDGDSAWARGAAALALVRLTDTIIDGAAS